MERLTYPAGTGCYTTDQPEAALGRLGRWEDLYEALAQELAHASGEIARLAAAGKEKSAAYRQHFGNKLALASFLSRLDACR